MTNKMKKIFILTPLIILLCLFGVYFLFPGVMFDLLKTAERSAAGLKQHSVYVEGLRIEYLEGGKGDTLVLLHGFGANKDNWTRFGKYLTSHFRVIAPDLTGFGESSPDPDGNYTIRVQAERIKAFIRALGIKPLHLGGNSMEDNIGQSVATRGLLSELRDAGEITGGPPPLKKRDRSRFLQQLDEMIQSIHRKHPSNSTKQG